MFAYATKEPIDTEVDFVIDDFGDDVENGKTIEIDYWRKFNNLHGWMEKLYREKGGKSEEFNLDNVLLTLEDLDKLEEDVDKGSEDLSPTLGFFFGSQEELDNDGKYYIREFINNARRYINKGYNVYYTSWW